MSASPSDPTSWNGTVRPIIRWGTPILHRHLKPVSSSHFRDQSFDTLIRDMFATMYAAQGAGLAANQVGVDLKVCVYDLTVQGVRSWGVLCNPEVLQNNSEGDETGMQTMNEGCLSYPGFSTYVPRPEAISIRSLNKDGEPQELQAKGHLAGILQHEIDHLNGLVYGDHVSPSLRKAMDDKYKELEEEKAFPEDWPVSDTKHKWIPDLQRN